MKSEKNINDEKLRAFLNIVFVNEENEVLAIIYNGDIVAKKGYRILLDSDFDHLEERGKDGRIFARKRLGEFRIKG